MKSRDSERYIPADLWPGLLCRLPVKSLLRFRCVSKSWLSLVDSRDFAHLHLENFTNNRDETRLLVVQHWENFAIRSSDTFETNLDTVLTPGKGRWDFVCSVDGLVVLKSNSPRGKSRFQGLKVWNPSIRKFHELAPLTGIEVPTETVFEDLDVGLGYDPLVNDYKHVKVVRVADRCWSVAVYSLGTASWKVIPFQGEGCTWHGNLTTNVLTGNVYLRGSLYFIPYNGRNDRDEDLVSFDLSNEVFSSIKLPAFEGTLKLGLIDSGSSIAVYTISWDISVWVLDNSGEGSESPCWTKRYLFRLEFRRFLYFNKNGDMLIQKDCRETLKNETGKKQVVWDDWDQQVVWDQVASYNPETEEYKIVQERKGSYRWIRHVSTYVESLLLLK